MTTHIVIIENNSHELQSLTQLLENYGKEHKLPISVSPYHSGEEFFSATTQFSAHLYILDIQLTGMNGIDIAKRLRNQNYNGEIIFLTSYSEYVFEGYQVHALNYILKPVDKAHIYPCLDEIIENHKSNHYIFRHKQEIIQIEYRDIVSFSSSLHSIDILTVQGNFIQYATLNSILGHLPKEFVRIHRSHIVNMTHIHKISANTITLSNHLTIPIGRKYMDTLRNAFANYSTRFDISF